MQVVVIGAGGGLGRNVVDAALAAGHAVRAIVRDPARAGLPSGVEMVRADARNGTELGRAIGRAGAAFFCVNPRFKRWLDEFPQLLEAAIDACRDTGVRLVFPANVWIYGAARPEQEIDERRPATPTSKRGALRARMEAKLRMSGARYCVVRLPEFYGPHVVSLTARVFLAAIRHDAVLWPGPRDVAVEFVYMPDAARALVEVGTAPDTDGETFHVPGARTTPGRFIRAVGEAAGRVPRMLTVPPLLLRLRGVGDIAHLWTAPVLLDGSKYVQCFGSVPMTPYAQAIPATLEWYRAHQGIELQG
ncbi:MAG TPA: NAD(P)H-binding protein [Thermoanaerobaculia bacterium]|nr:NAD(P)H-binding protein [Thermoanaerobaculia bacterium]